MSRNNNNNKDQYTWMKVVHVYAVKNKSALE